MLCKTIRLFPLVSLMPDVGVKNIINAQITIQLLRNRLVDIMITDWNTLFTDFQNIMTGNNINENIIFIIIISSICIGTIYENNRLIKLEKLKKFGISQNKIISNSLFKKIEIFVLVILFLTFKDVDNAI
jgi:hypothetical protein